MKNKKTMRAKELSFLPGSSLLAKIIIYDSIKPDYQFFLDFQQYLHHLVSN